MQRVQRGRGLFIGCPVYETMEERGILDMKRRIIDFHTHLGDIFHDSRNIVFHPQLHFPPYPDPFEDLARDHYSRALVTENQEEQNILIDAGQLRTWEYGSLEATQKALDENHIDYAVSLPVMPNSSFEEALAASKLEPRLLPFTSADFRLPIPEMKAKLKRDIIRGAKGLKLHPILQNVPLTDERTYAAVEVFGEMGLPITSHCGINDYYKPGSKYQPLAPKEYGELHYMLALIERYPDYILIPAHAGGDCGWEYEELAQAVHRHGWKNVYTDTSFKNAKVMRELAGLFGEDKLLFATDYPFDGITQSVAACEEAFADDPVLADKVFYGNAAKLLHL